MRIRSLMALVLLTGAAQAGDWPQWNGPKRDGHADEKGLLKAWPKGGPKLLWTFKDGGTGYTAPAVVGGKVYTMGARKGDEYVIALDSKGMETWATKIAPPFDFKGNNWSLGPNSTPSVDGELLYAFGSQGVLLCLETATGKEKWRNDLVKNLGAVVNPIGGGAGGWGFSWSPLVDGDQVIVTPGGKMGLVAALDKITGKVKWQTQAVKDECIYASPTVADIAGVRQYIVPKQGGAVGIEAKTGAVLWTYKTKKNWPDVACVTPLIYGDQVFLTATHGGCDLFEIKKTPAGFTTEPKFANNYMANFHGGVVKVGDYAYGSYELRDWRCLNLLMKGKQEWADNNLGVGSVIVADGLMYTLGQDTDKVSLVEMSPKGLKVVGEFPLPAISNLRKGSAKAWAHPVVADGKLFIREQEMLFCFALK